MVNKKDTKYKIGGTIHNNHYLTIKEYVLNIIDWNHWYNKIKLQDIKVLQ